VIELAALNGLTLRVARPAVETRPPILFVHGYFGGSWYFERYLRFFAGRGYPGCAPDLRGHHGSRPVPDIGAVPFAAYVEDALEVARSLAGRRPRRRTPEQQPSAMRRPMGAPGPWVRPTTPPGGHSSGSGLADGGADEASLPIVIGHSLGGLVAQKLAEAGAVRAAVLVCPAPPRGIPPLGGHLLRRMIPYLPAIIGSRPILGSLADHAALTLNCVPEEEHPALYARFVADSGRAARDILLGVPVDASRVRCPVLVVSATKDRFVPARVARRVAAKYRAPFRAYVGRGHFLPAEPGWEVPARAIEHWLDYALRFGRYGSPGVIHLQELAKQRGRTVQLRFRDGHAIRAKLISVELEEPSEIVYEVHAVLDPGPDDVAPARPGSVAAAPLEALREFEVL
jgi:pimeloyl-ACP methyl ester carboxylesterase